MDFAMLNAAYRSDVYPPGDPWMAGMPVAYYYLGYLTNATLAKLAAIPTAAAFNLAIATAGAQAAVGAFAVTANLAAAASRRPLFESVRLRPAHLLAGLGAAVLLTAVSNLEGMVELLRARGWGSADLYAWMSIKDLRLTGPSSLWF
ncbi:MAG: DUF2298 domain-containing protein, partial [Chloroflexi bacterium]|nr:DUF2298 domain-containing protein [Chloroflexota bacterium]